MIRSIYNQFLRPLLPRKYGSRRGVAIKDVALFDVSDTKPMAEKRLINGTESVIERGDRVVIIGGGKGISMFYAAIAAGPNGFVTVYEPSANRIEMLNDLVERSLLGDRTNIIHGIVGEGKHIPDDPGSAEVIDPSDVPEADVMELDCEGAERIILDNIETWPRAIVMEFHEAYGASRTWAKETLLANGYEPEWFGWDNKEIGAGVIVGSPQEPPE